MVTVNRRLPNPHALVCLKGKLEDAFVSSKIISKGRNAAVPMLTKACDPTVQLMTE